MYKVKSFGSEVKPMKTMQELAEIDAKVEQFLSENDVKEVISVSDMPTTDDRGATIGLIRVLCYRV
jgi:predicted ATP-grasp superfamily ATP-dependent carboligase